MKKYFAKYLPVEGEMKEGIKVKYSGGKLNFPDTVYTVLDNVKKGVSIPSVPGYGIYHHISTEELENGKKKITGSYLKIGYNIEEQEVQIVKLFLCSRDIQVGDTYIDLSKYGKSIPYTDSDGTWKSMPVSITDTCDSKSLKEYLKDKPHCFKLIGEISPEATWVKEGDEFDEGEVELWWYDSFVKSNPVLRFEAFPDFLEKTFPKPLNYIVLGKIKGPCGHFH